MRRPITGALGLMTAAILAAPGPVAASVCPEVPPGRRLEMSAAVFCGRLISMEQRTIRIAPGGSRRPRRERVIVYTFRVLAAWKGAETPTLEVISLADGVNGPDYLPNADLLVYAYESRGHLWGSACAPNDPIQFAVYDRFVLGTPAYAIPGYDVPGVVLSDLFDALDAIEPPLHDSAVRGLGHLESERDVVLPRLVEVLTIGTAREQEGAAAALGIMRPEAQAAVPALERALESPVATTRIAVHRSMVRVLGGEGYFEHAIRGLGDPADDVRLAVIECLRTRRGKVSEREQGELARALERVIATSGPRAATEAIQALAMCDCEAAYLIPTLDRIRDAVGHAERKRAAWITGMALRNDCGID